MKQIIKKSGEAIRDFNLIEENDVIGIGLSGGKDSLALVKVMTHFKRVSPINFDIKAITVDMGFENTNYSPLQKFCDNLNVEFHLAPSRIKEIVFDIRNESNPCSLCANLRRGALNNFAKSLGCNKVALGHHREDAIETLLMSMLYEGRINAFKPKTYLSRVDLEVIRPMVYVKEQSIITLAKENNFPIVVSTCPNCSNSSREKIKNIINEIEKEIPITKHNLLNSLSHVMIENLWIKDKE